MIVSKISGLIYPNNFTKNNRTTTTNFGLKMSPELTSDTLSFKGTPKIANKNWKTNYQTARKINRSLKEAEQKLVNFIETNFKDLIVSEKEPKNPIYAIKHRIKSPTSIMEKSGTREWFPDEIKTNMTDLLGMKFEMRASDKATVESVLDRFIPLIRTRQLELLEIENKRPGYLKDFPDNMKDKYDYASIPFLKKLINIQEETWKNAHKGAEKALKVNQVLENDFTDANYCAIHFLFRTTGKHSQIFELQLMGSDIAIGKRVDDLAFKQLNNKDIDDKYAAVKKIFEPFTKEHFFENEPNGEAILADAKDKINKYRQMMFLFQREKEPLVYKKKKKVERFLPLPYKLFPSDIELKYGIDSTDFDYNNLYELIENADRKAERMAKTKKSTTTVKNI